MAAPDPDPALLPQDIIREEILTRLSIESLVRFRCVCKFWNSLFSDPDFIQSHSNRSISQTPNDYLILNTFKGRFPNITNYYDVKYPYALSILSRTNLSETHIDQLPYPLLSQDDMHLVGSLNGLVCIAFSYDQLYYSFILWNPAIRLSKTILIPSSYPSYLFGFGWDSVANDYKLIAKPSSSLELDVLVYSCKTDSWSNKLVSNLSFLPITSWYPSVIVKGIPYWKFYQRSEILKFEIRINEFAYLKLPHVCQGYSTLLNLNDCLALMEYAIDGGYVYRFDEECSLWSKMYTIITTILKPPSMCFKYGGEIVFDGKKNLYDPKSNEIKSLGDYAHIVQGFSYTPSLIALEGMKP